MRQTGRAELDEEEEDLGHWLKSILDSSWNGYVTVSGDTTISLGPVKTRQGLGAVCDNFSVVTVSSVVLAKSK
jgi:hypothetical protein